MQTKYTVQCKIKGTNIRINPDCNDCNVLLVLCWFNPLLCVGYCMFYILYICKKEPWSKKRSTRVKWLSCLTALGPTQTALRRTETIKDAHFFFNISMFFLHDEKKVCACVDETKEFVCVCFVFCVTARPCWLLCLCAAFLIASSVNVKRSNGAEPSRFIFSFVLHQMQAALLLLARRNYCYPAKCADE